MNNTLNTLEKFYVDKKFDKGIDFLLDHKNDLKISSFHYYFGSFEMKIGNLAVGKYHLKLAVKNGFMQEDIFHNLNVADQALQLTKAKDSLSLKDQVLFTSLNIHTEWYLIFALGLSLIFLVGYWREWFSKKRWVILGILLCCTPLFVKLSWLDSHKFAVALKDTDVREGPSNLYEISGKLPAGLTLIIGRIYNGQVYIKSPSIYEGWVKKETLGVL